jgi:hypothetical protein
MNESAKVLRRCLAVGVVCLAVWGCGRTQPAKEQESAIDRLRKAAEHGDAQAQYDLGVQYAKGDGVPQDEEIAMACYRKAAELGYVEAQNRLAFWYYEGRGVGQNYAEAAKWWRKAAEQGNAEAQYWLAWCYDEGRGVGQNYAEAAEWWRKAAEQGDAGSQISLACLYDEGLGVPKDAAEAFKWTRKAAEQGDVRAQRVLGECYSDRKGVRQDYAKAAKWYLRAAEQGDAVAQYNLGVCYCNGQGVPQNDIEAYKWFSLAAAQGQKGSVEVRDSITKRMARAEVIEGQRLASVFAVRKEYAGSGSDRISPKPEIGEGKVVAGTGFFVTDDGYLVTCEHVVRGATSLSAKLSGRSVPARLIKKDRTIDVALLKVNGAFRALPVKPESGIKLGDAVFTIGFPNPVVQGVEPKLTRGEISSMAGIRDNPRYFQISVPVQPGNSGGALVDESGNVVGVVTARLDDVATYEISGALPQNVNYAVKGRLVRDFLNSVPELSSKLKTPRTTKDREAASAAAERAAVLVIAQ